MANGWPSNEFDRGVVGSIVAGRSSGHEQVGGCLRPQTLEFTSALLGEIEISDLIKQPFARVIGHLILKLLSPRRRFIRSPSRRSR